jgi:hypothetical protein
VTIANVAAGPGNDRSFPGPTDAKAYSLAVWSTNAPLGEPAEQQLPVPMRPLQRAAVVIAHLCSVQSSSAAHVCSESLLHMPLVHVPVIAMRQVTAFALPQVERTAQRTVLRRQRRLSVPADARTASLVACATQRT